VSVKFNFGCPFFPILYTIGVKKAQDALTAIVIRNGLMEATRPSAILIPIGAINTTVAALLITPDRITVVTRKMPNVAQIGNSVPIFSTVLAIRSAPPVVSNASLTGIIAPRSIITGQSMLVYISRTETTFVSTNKTAAIVNAICTGSNPATTAAMAIPNIPTARIILRG